MNTLPTPKRQYGFMVVDEERRSSSGGAVPVLYLILRF
jgi:hypothetical protein